MDVTVLPDGIGILTTIISLAILVLGIYTITLIIKSLKIYIKKNS